MSSVQPKDETTPTPKTPLGRWQFSFFYGWIIVAIVFLAEFMAAGMGTLTIGLFFSPMSASTDWSLTQLTGAVTAQALVAMILAPVVGPAIDRFGARAVMLFGGLTAGIGLILLGEVRSIWQFWVLYALVGALGLHELGNLTGPVVVSKWFVRLRGRAMAIATLGTVVGAMVMAPIIGILVDILGWRDTWKMMGAILLITIIPPVALLMRRQPEDLGLYPDGDLHEDTVSQHQGANTSKRLEDPTGESIWTLKEALHTRSLWLIVIAMNLASFAASAQVIHTAPFLTQQEGMSTSAASLVIMTRLAIAAIARIPWGFLAERIPLRICLALSFAGRSLGLMSLVLLPFPYNLPIFIVLSGTAAAWGLLQPMIFSDYFGRTFQGTIQGVLRPFLAGPGLAIPLITAFLFDTTGTFDIAFIIAAAPGILAIFLVLFATPPSKNPQYTSNSKPLSY